MMTNRRFLICAAAALAATASIAAQRPAALAPAAGGLWEVDDKIGGAPPRRLCVRNPAALANIEHHGRSCALGLVGESGATALFRYSCSRGDFGRSELTLITPRSIRIDTQGISAGVPFHHVLQARRIGDC